jgi:7-carboxy-7-deazaguanine synthase
MNDAPAAPAVPADRLKITEARDAGWPTVFVRLTGCPLRCQYCDTTYSFFGGEWRSIDDLLAEVAAHGVRHVCVTGGEPLSQKRCLDLLRRLCDAGYVVSLETSGAIDIADVDPRVSRVLDIKTPGSAEVERNRWENLPLLTAHDQIKFVICGRDDYEWSRDVLRQHRLHERCDVLFSPSKDQVSARDLADWIVADRLPVKFQMQLHKILWNDEPGR